MNKTQREFKKQMKRGLKEVKKRNKENYYKYLMNNHLDDPEQRYTQEKKKRVKRFFGKVFKIIFNILIIIILISVAAVYIKEKTKDEKMASIKSLLQPNVISNSTINSNQQGIIKYLNEIKPYNNKIIEDIKSLSNDAKSFNIKQLTQKEYGNNLLVYKNRININSTEIDKISCPQELIKYKYMIKQHNQIICTAIDYEIQYLTSNDNSKLQLANENYKKYNNMNTNIDNEINSVLDKNGIKH